MSILGKGLRKIRDFSSRARSRRIADLLKDSASTEQAFLLESKRLGIDVRNFNLKSYYDVLGIKYTSDQKEIKDSYVRLVKQYHPDVSSDSRATQRTEEINEAYGVLKDRQSKEQYDLKFSKGRNRMSSDTTRILYAQLLRRYQEARSRDFEEFNKRVANPQEINNLRATVEETVNWTRRFRQVSNNAFGKFWDYGTKFKRLKSVNNGLIKAEKDDANLSELSANLARLEGLIQAFDEAEKGIAFVIDRVKNDIATGENNLADRLRRSVN